MPQIAVNLLLLSVNENKSVVILAFVKSEGKATEKSTDEEPSSPTEQTNLLSERHSSLEGSLRERVVRKSVHVQSIYAPLLVKLPSPPVSILA